MPGGRRLDDDGEAGRGGVLVIDKPAGPTSHDVVAVVRRAFRGAKAGHTGTLDPFATGVLPVVIGRATRLARFLAGADKEYDALVRLGRSTDTYDITGRVVYEAPEGVSLPSPAVVAEVVHGYLGSWMQTPPAFSAKQADGVRAYEQARRGKAVELAPVPVRVEALDVLSVDGPLVRLRLVSSAGFYVRALAQDLGERLGTGATLEGLRRLRSGAFGLADAVTLDAVVRSEAGSRVLPLDALLTDWPAAVLTAEGVDWVAHGRAVGPGQCVGPLPARSGTPVRLVGPDGSLLAVGEPGPGGVLHPAVVLV
jgi:tRNA pseudouridine55 synthase